MTKDPEEVSNRIYKKNKWYVNFAIILLLIIGGYMLYTYKLKDMYVEYLLSKIEFTTSQVKGICPLQLHSLIIYQLHYLKILLLCMKKRMEIYPKGN